MSDKAKFQNRIENLTPMAFVDLEYARGGVAGDLRDYLSGLSAALQDVVAIAVNDDIHGDYA